MARVDTSDNRTPPDRRETDLGRDGYSWQPPFAWRALAAFGYLSWAFGLGLLVPISITFLYRNRFLTTHAINAAVLHAVGLLVIGVLYALNFAVIIETGQQILSLTQFWGGAFANQMELWGTMLFVQTAAFIIWATRTALIPEVTANRRNFVTGARIPIKALLAVLLVLATFYNEIFWPGQSRSGLPINVSRFSDPFVLFPGHLILCCAMFMAMIAFEGRFHRFRLARGVYARFLRDRRATGQDQRRAALARSVLLPGWGQAYLGSVVSGVATACLFLLLLLFLTLSILFNYSRLVADIPGLNANAGWYLLAEMGLRSHIPDTAFLGLFGNWIALAGLALAVFGCFLYSRWSTKRLLSTETRQELRLVGPHSVLLHTVPVVILLLIPVSFQMPGTKRPPEGEPLLVIPEYFEPPERKLELNGATTSGDESQTYGRSGTRSGRTVAGGAANAPRYAGPGQHSQARKGTDDKKLLLDSRNGDDPSGGRPGKRQDMTYSNYLSAKIRGAEKGLGYFSRLPTPYSGVFEYKISERGELYDISVLEPSNSPEADRLTLELIRAMGTVLPPPGGGHVIVRELFWNTTPADSTLPSELQRSLSNAFDGRLIQRF